PMPDTPNRPPTSEQMRAWIESVKDPSQILRPKRATKPRPSPEVPTIKLEGDIARQIETARTIMGPDAFFGPEQIKEKYPYVRLPDIIPPIPFDQDRMERERNADMVLRLVCDTAQDGAPLTGSKLNELLLPSYTARNVTFLFNEPWYKTDPLFTTQTPRLAWVFMATELLPDSTNKNYVDQTQTIAVHIRNLWQGSDARMPQQDRDDLREWDEYYRANFAAQTPEEITALLNGETIWKKYAQELSNLGINQHNRGNLVEHLDHIAFMRQAADKKSLKTTYAWTATRSDDGFLVVVGNAEAVGAFLHRWEPGGSDGAIGVLLVRR
ncbi:hypothetical protein HY621_04350, partial [Candidatus Uhrbacteria bacterium]|nr:hypothetical protein [Candidatus Uhrbacteria bacterium]